jgi:hypothetical protein
LWPPVTRFSTSDILTTPILILQSLESQGLV